jgi:hypothetical protein
MRKWLRRRWSAGMSEEGYAKYELSADGDRGHIAAQHNERWFAGNEG